MALYSSRSPWLRCGICAGTIPTSCCRCSLSLYPETNQRANHEVDAASRGRERFRPRAADQFNQLHEMSVDWDAAAKKDRASLEEHISIVVKPVYIDIRDRGTDRIRWCPKGHVRFPS